MILSFDIYVNRVETGIIQVFVAYEQ